MIPSSSCPPWPPDITGQIRRRARATPCSYTTTRGTIQQGSHGRESVKVVPRVPASWVCAKAGPSQHRRPSARPGGLEHLRRSRLPHSASYRYFAAGSVRSRHHLQIFCNVPPMSAPLSFCDGRMVFRCPFKWRHGASSQAPITGRKVGYGIRQPTFRGGPAPTQMRRFRTFARLCAGTG
jgi:hypothetical protein